MFDFFRRRNRAQKQVTFIDSAAKDPITSPPNHRTRSKNVSGPTPAQPIDDGSRKRRRVWSVVEKESAEVDRSLAEGRIKVRSSDGEIFEVERMVLMESEVMRTLIDGEDVISVPNVTGRILAIVLDYCRKRVGEDEDHEAEDDNAVTRQRKWAARLFAMDQPTFFDVSLAAYHLKIKSLLDLTSQTVADMIKGKSLTEIRKVFSIEEDNGNDTGAAK